MEKITQEEFTEYLKRPRPMNFRLGSVIRPLSNLSSLATGTADAISRRGSLRTDQLGLTYHYYMDRAIAAQRVNNPPPVLIRRGDDGSIWFK